MEFVKDASTKFYYAIIVLMLLFLLHTIAIIVLKGGEWTGLYIIITTFIEIYLLVFFTWTRFLKTAEIANKTWAKVQLCMIFLFAILPISVTLFLFLVKEYLR